MTKPYDRLRARHSRVNAKSRHQGPRQLVVILSAFLTGYLTATVFDFTSLRSWLNQHVAKTQALPLASPVTKELPQPKLEFYTLLAKNNNEPFHQPATPPSSGNQSVTEKVVKTVTPILPTTQPANPGSALIPNQKSINKVLTTESKEVKKPLELASKIDNRLDTKVEKSESKVELKPDYKVENKTDTKPLESVIQGNKEPFVIQMASFNRRQEAEQTRALLLLKGFDATIVPVNYQNTTWYRVTIGPFYSRNEAQKAQTAAQVVISRNEQGNRFEG